MTTTINRRDFLNGIAIAVIGALSGDSNAAAWNAEGALNDPPRRAGLRGSHPGSFEIAHAVRDGRRFDLTGIPVEERYDLVVVGAGISGLAAAYFYRKRRPSAKILILEANDDFGGHAKRNEFIVDGRLLIGYGGTQSIDSPKRRYRGVPSQLLRELGLLVDGKAEPQSKLGIVFKQRIRPRGSPALAVF